MGHSNCIWLWRNILEWPQRHADDAESNFILSNAEKPDVIISANLTISVRKETASVALSNDTTFQLLNKKYRFQHLHGLILNVHHTFKDLHLKSFKTSWAFSNRAAFLWLNNCHNYPDCSSLNSKGGDKCSVLSDNCTFWLIIHILVKPSSWNMILVCVAK